MTTIAIHIVATSTDGEIQSARLSSIDEVELFWSGLDASSTACVVDIGFFPPTPLPAKAVADYAGQLLMTPTMAGVLRKSTGLRTKRLSVGELRPWPTEAASRIIPVDTSAFMELDEPWILALAESDIELARQLLAAGIRTDEDYLNLEKDLEPSARERAGIFRFRHLCPLSPHVTTFEIQQVLPPWLLERKLEELPLTVRIRNVLFRENMVHVADLLQYSERAMLALQHFGRTSYQDLGEILHAAVLGGIPFRHEPSDTTSSVVESIPAPKTFAEQFARTFDGLDDRQKAILIGRSGSGGAFATLEVLADRYGVTRERIRQIEAKLAKSFRSTDWAQALGSIADEAIRSKNRPIQLEELLEHPWLAGSEKWLGMIPYLLEHACSSTVRHLSLDDYESFVLAHISQQGWNDLVSKAKALSHDLIGKSLPEYQASIRSLFPKDAVGLEMPLFDLLGDRLHFDDSPLPVLRSVGLSVEDATIAVVASLPQPAHQELIHEQVQARMDKPVSLSRVVTSLLANAVNFGGRTFGNERHIGINKVQIGMILKTAEATVGSDLNRQWHVQELLDVIRRHLPNIKIDKNVLQHLLHSSKRMVSIGKMSWRHFDSDIEDNLDMHAVVVRVLEDAGGPLMAMDIKKHVARARGLNETAQIYVKHPVIRIVHGVYGLAGRDDHLLHSD